MYVYALNPSQGLTVSSRERTKLSVLKNPLQANSTSLCKMNKKSIKLKP
jgi:hypothetical protein